MVSALGYLHKPVSCRQSVNAISPEYILKFTSTVDRKLFEVMREDLNSVYE